MPNDPRIMTPGSEVADTLQTILARKRDESRQAMLDRLAADEQRSVQESRLDSSRMAEKNFGLNQDQLREQVAQRAAENQFNMERIGQQERANAFERETNAPRPLTTVSPGGRLTTHQGTMVPPNQSVLELNFPPSTGGGGAAWAPKPYQVFDAQGNEKGSAVLDPSQAAQFIAQNPGFSLRPAGFQEKTATQVPAALRNAVTKAKEKVIYQRGQDDKRWFADSRDPTAETTAAEAELSSALGQLAAADPNVTPNVIDAVTSVVSDPSLAGTQISQLELTNEDGTPLVLTPKEIQAAEKLLISIQGMDLMPTGNQ